MLEQNNILRVFTKIKGLMLCWTPTYGTDFSQFITGHRRELAAWSNSSGVTHINISLPQDLFILTSCCSVGSQGSHHCCPFRIRLNIDHGHALTCPSIIPTPMCPFPWGESAPNMVSNTWFLGPGPSTRTKRHLDRFDHFAELMFVSNSRHTDRQHR